jgi:catechol 2,3-dioxygenase
MTVSVGEKAQDAPTIHPATRLGAVHYTAADLDRQIAFYRDILGFKLHWREGDSAGLGAGGEDLLRLTEVPGARRVRGATGLYHTAFLVPTRWDLAHLLKRIIETRTPIQGTANHGTHLALYLPDAEGNGIELAWDFPREQWPRTGEEMLLNNRAMDIDALLGALAENPAPWEGLDPATRVGHVHLHVADLDRTEHFYHDVLGFDQPFELPARMGAKFFAAGGYHHHIGANTWQGAGAPPPPDDAVGLRHFTIALPDAAERARVLARVRDAGIAAEPVEGGSLVRDPSGIGVLLAADSAG